MWPVSRWVPGEGLEVPEGFRARLGQVSWLVWLVYLGTGISASRFLAAVTSQIFRHWANSPKTVTRQPSTIDYRHHCAASLKPH